MLNRYVLLSSLRIRLVRMNTWQAWKMSAHCRDESRPAGCRQRSQAAACREPWSQLAGLCQGMLRRGLAGSCLRM